MARTSMLLFLLALAGCGGATANAPARKGPMDIRDAGLPFVLYDRDGRRVSEQVMLDALAAARAVCVGEAHSNPHHHWAQLHLVDALSRRAVAGGTALAFGFEMFQSPFQQVLDAYAAGTIDERVLIARSEWRERWGTDFRMYEPMLRLAVERGHVLLALNQRREIVSKVGKGGLAGLTDEERAALPELVVDDAQHRAWFDSVMESHPGLGGGGSPHGPGWSGESPPGDDGAGESPHGDDGDGESPHGDDGDGESPHGDDGAGESPHEDDGAGEDHADGDADARMDNVYTAQVIWDETMADNAAKWLAGAADRKVVILAGNGHCHDSAIVRRLARRGFAPSVSVQPVIDDGQGGADDALRAQHNDYVLVMVLE